MIENIKNWNKKKTERKITIYNIDHNWFEYEINMHDKEYQSLINYESNLQRISYHFYSASSDKRMEINMNNYNHVVEIENELDRK